MYETCVSQLKTDKKSEPGKEGRNEVLPLAVGLYATHERLTMLQFRPHVHVCLGFHLLRNKTENWVIREVGQNLEYSGEYDHPHFMKSSKN